MKILLSILGVIGVAIAVLVGSYFTAYSSANKSENLLVALKENNENILAQYGQKISEAAQIPQMQADDLTRIFTASLEARYGADGSKAGMQWIQEQNPQLDQATYLRLQTMIEAGRKDFELGQTKLIDAKRSYQTALGSLWTGTFMRIAGFPKINLEDFKPVSTARAKDAFETGIEAPMTLRPSN